MRRQVFIRWATMGFSLLIVIVTIIATVVLFKSEHTLYKRRDAIVLQMKTALESNEPTIITTNLQNLRALEKVQNNFLVTLASCIGSTLLIIYAALMLLVSRRIADADLTAAQLSVTKALVESQNIEEAALRILSSIGDLYSFSFGALWLVDERAGRIKAHTLWESKQMKEHWFWEATYGLSFKKGIGVPGRVWQSGNPAWVKDVTKDTNFPRAGAAAKCNLHSAIGFPILKADKTVGVLEFYLTKKLTRQRKLVDLLVPFGLEIGQFIERLESKARLVEEARISKFAAGIGQALGSHASPQAMLQQCAEIAIKELDAVLGCAWIKCPDGPCFELQAAAGNMSLLPDVSKLWLDDASIKLLKRAEGKYALIGHLIQRIAAEKDRELHDFVPLMAQPLMVGDELVGLIAALPRHIFSENVRPALTFTSKNIALGISRRQMESQLRESERLYSEITGNIDEMIWVTQPGGFGLKWVSPALARFFNRSQEQILKEPMGLFEGIHESDRNLALTFFHNSTSRPANMEYRQRDAHDKWHWLWCRSYPTFDENGRLAEVYGIASDITAKKEGEKHVQEFYSMVSHELRTPLTSIHASLRIMEAGLLGQLPEKIEELVKIARTESDRLIRLINDILDIRKLEEGMLELKPVTVRADKLVQQSIAELQGMAESAGVQLCSQFDWNGEIKVDQDRTTQMLDNLISNAIKFSPKGGQVLVLIDKMVDYVRFSVTDQGPGIAADQIGKLFGKFQQLDSSDSRPKGGTGLGLAITKAIAEQHGGNVGLQSTVGKGSTFWIKLPLANLPKTEQNPALPRKENHNSKRHNILLVEKDGNYARELTQDLAKNGFDLTTVNSFGAAEEYMSHSQPEAILADLEGLSLEGMQWLHQNMSRPNWPRTIVLAENKVYDNYAKNTRITAWHCKPVSITTLRGALGFAVAAVATRQC
ncbi:MAG: GAF domain-containing protein [Cyanobacteria bacterium SZAS TMP-1]|nr:GAF domain-containing protein [Cyanobacteria bacterium SZAS TMP-1]